MQNIQIEQIKKELGKYQSGENSNTKDLLKYLQESSLWLKGKLSK